MDSILKSQPYANYSVSARNLPKSDLAGVIFGCKNSTIEECITKQLFGLPQTHFSYIRNIEEGLPLFLFNYDARELYGIFEAASGGRLNPNSYAWTDGSKRTPYPAQVSVRIRKKCQPLSEDQFKRVLEKNYFIHRHFWFELDRSQARALIDLFRPLPSSEWDKLVHGRNNILAASQATQSKVTSNDRSMLVKSKDRALPVNLVDWNTFPLLGKKINTKPENLTSQGRSYANVCKRDTTSHYNLVDQNNSVSHSWGDEHIENRSIGKTPSFGPECLESEEPVSDWEEWVLDDVQINPSHACNPSIENNQLYHKVSDSPLKPKGIMLSNLEKLVIGNQCSTLYDEQFLNAKVPGSECMKSEEPVSGWEEWTQENAQIIPSDACNPSTEDSLLYNMVSNNPLVPKESLFNLEKPGIGQCSTSFEDQVFIARKHRENASLPLYENTELLQSLIGLKEWKLTMERKQIELHQEIQGLNYSLIEKERKIQHLSNHVNELELKLDSTLGFGDSPNLCAQQCLGSENNIYLLGGFNGISWLSSLDAFSPSLDELTPLRPMKFARVYAPVVALDGNIYTFGGGDGSSWYNSVECYNRRDDQWTSCASLIREKGSLAGATLHGKIYAIGGGDGSGCFSDVEVYDPALGKWIFGQSMLRKRFAPAAAELNGAIYAVGGYDGHDYMRLAERYDAREPHWNMIPSMNSRRGCHSLAVLNEKLYAVGGYDGDHMVSSVEFLDPRMPSWVMTESMADIRGCCAAVVLDDTLFVIGGVKDGDIILDTVESYKEVIGWRNTGLKSVGKRCFCSAISF